MAKEVMKMQKFIAKMAMEMEKIKFEIFYKFNFKRQHFFVDVVKYKLIKN
jgi:hypothetical protein